MEVIKDSEGNYKISGNMLYSIFTGNSSLEVVRLIGTFSRIPSYCFYKCKNMHTIVINDQIESIGDYSFYGCTKLSTINYPSSLMSIENYAFASCSSLTTLPLPNSVSFLGNSAFESCTSITTVTLSTESMFISSNAFSSCENLNTVNVQGSFSEIGNLAFFNCNKIQFFNITGNITSISYQTFHCCNALEYINISSSVSKIYDEAFKDCEALKTVELPDTIEYIGDGAFTNCKSLTTFKIPRDLTFLPTNLCANCTMIQEIILNDNNITFKSNCFSGCSSLKKIKFESENLKDLTIESHAFSQTPIEEITIINMNIIFYSEAFVFKRNTDSDNEINFLKNVTIKGGNIFIERDCFQKFYIDDSVLHVECINMTIKKVESFAPYTFKSIEIEAENDIIMNNRSFMQTNIASIKIKCTNLDIGEEVFSYCRSLTNLVIDCQNAHFHEKCFHLCNINRIDLTGKNFTFDPNSFMECQNLQAVFVWGENIIFGGNCFYYNRNLNNLEVYGENVSFLTSSFNSCPISTFSLYAQHCIIEDYVFHSSRFSEFTIAVIDISKESSLVCSSAGGEDLTKINLQPFTTIIFKGQIVPESNSLKEIEIVSNVFRIEDIDTFVNCDSLAKVNITSDEIFIDKYNFNININQQNDLSLYFKGKNIIFNENIFELTNVVLLDIEAENVIITRSFNEKTNLQTLKIYSTDNIIIDGCFSQCSSLSYLDFESNNITILSNSFSNCENLHVLKWVEGINYISHKAFSGCSITNIIYPQGKREIIPGAFSCWSNLQSFSINRFSRAEGDYEISSQITKIGDYAFHNCPNLEYAEFSSSIISFGTHIFDLCPKLKTITSHSESFFDVSNIAESVVSLNINNYKQFGYFKSTNANEIYNKNEIPIGEFFMSNIEEFTGKSVTKINKYAFYKCTKLRTVELSDELDYIGDYAFFDCVSLENFEIKSSTKYIGENSLTNVKSIIFPDVFTNSVTFGSNCISPRNFNLNLNSEQDITINNMRSDSNSEFSISCNSLTLNSFSGESISKLVITSRDRVYIGTNSFNSITDLTINGKNVILESYFMNDDNNLLQNIVINCETLQVKNHSFPKLNAIQKISFVASNSIELGTQIFSNERATETKIEIIGGDVTFGEESLKNCRFVNMHITGNNLKFLRSSLFDVVIMNGETIISSNNDILFEVNSISPYYGKFEISAANNIIFDAFSVVLTYFTVDGYIQTEVMKISASNQILLKSQAFTALSLKKLEMTTNNLIAENNIFYFCSFENVSLVAVNLELGNKTFFDIQTLSALKIEGNLRKIPEYAFSQTSIQNIELRGVNEIGASAFENNERLESVDIEGEISLIGKSSYQNCNNLKSVRLICRDATIEESSFNSCPELETLSIGTIKEIGDSAFSGCLKLSQFEDLTNCQKIGKMAFKNCGNLVSIEIPRNVKIIEEMTFQECRSLVSVTFHDKIEKINQDSFALCVKLNQIRLFGNIILDSAFRECNELSKVSISGDNITIGKFSFSNTKIYELKLTGNNLKIESSSFFGCTNLEKILITGKFNIIYKNAFQNSNVKELELGCDSVWDISSVHFDASIKISFGDNISFVNLYQIDDSLNPSKLESVVYKGSLINDYSVEEPFGNYIYRFSPFIYVPPRYKLQKFCYVPCRIIQGTETLLVEHKVIGFNTQKYLFVFGSLQYISL